MPIYHVKKTSKGRSFGPNQASIDTNIPSTQIKVCASLVGYFLLSNNSTPTKEATNNKRESLYNQITLQGQDHENKSLIKGYRLQLSSMAIYMSKEECFDQYQASMCSSYNKLLSKRWIHNGNK